MTSAPKTAKKRDLEAAKLAFVAWRLDANHQPPTQTELAKVLGVDVATLSDWKRDPLVVEHMKRAEQDFEGEWAIVLRAQMAIASNAKAFGSTQAATFLAKTFGKFKAEKVEHSGKVGLLEWLGGSGDS